MFARRFSLTILILLLALTLPAQENRTALIIGNGSYNYFPRLTNPAYEARQMQSALQRLGFDVILIIDGSEDDMYAALKEFEFRLKSRGGLAFFHYGGHGIQVKGTNYLIPVNADIPDELRVRSRAIEVDEVLSLMEASGSDTNVIILDACRDNPLPGSSRSGTRGLAAVHRPPTDSIIVYAADAGDTAQDGLFTPTLLKYIETPGTEFGDILRNVRRDVMNASGGRQRTGEYNQLISEIYLAGNPVANNRVERPDGGNGMVFVPGGTFQMGTKYGHDETPIHSVTVSNFWIGKTEVTQGDWEKVMDTTVEQQWNKNMPWKYTDRNSIGSSYPMYAISWDDAISYCNTRSQQEGLTPCYTVDGENINCNFSANGYRLPTEAEWEYAARGGASGQNTAYSGSDSADSVAWHKENSDKDCHPVGQKSPNELGLYDMSGNLYEWCWDWYEKYPSESMINPTGPPDGIKHVQRGGCYNLRSTITAVYSRYAYDGPAFYRNGFRLVRCP